MNEQDTQALAARLARYTELDAKRTQGEWDGEGYSSVSTNLESYNDGTSGWRIPGKSICSLDDGEYIENLNADNDAAFIASAPAMASDIRQLQAVIAELVGVGSAIKEYASHHDILCDDGVTFKPVAMVLIHDLVKALALASPLAGLKEKSDASA